MSYFWYAKFRHYPDVHLFEHDSRKCLCGVDRELARISETRFPGWPLCETCREERDKRRADEKAVEMQRKATEVRNWWLKGMRQ